MKEENTYIFGTSAAEAVHLVDQEHLVTEAVGGLFPIEIDIRQVATVLNLACGPGEWDYRAASEYPHMSIVGVDIDADVVKHATTLARTGFLDNVTFQRMNIKEPLDFPNDSFDLINGRLLFGCMDREAWPRLITECMRVLKPGGILLLTEYEVALSNSSALQQLRHYLYTALADQGRTFSIDKCSIGICPLLGKRLQDAGFVERVCKAFHVDCSFGSFFYRAGCRDIETAHALLKPYLMKTHAIEEATYEALLYQLQIEMRNEQFVNLAFGLQVWGYKP